jgi:hypothetical protein
MFRFTIRDLLWLMVVAGLGAGWFQELRHRGPANIRLRSDNERLRSEFARQRKEHQQEVEDLSAKVVRLRQTIENDREIRGWPWSYSADLIEDRPVQK